jgi:tetratricopeptide (TPR) repeat protein
MKSIIVLICIFLYLPVVAQNPVNKILERAEAYYAVKQYSLAIRDYERYLSKNINISVSIKLADCYSRSNLADKAFFLYEALVVKKKTADTINILYADLLKKRNEYSKAKEQYLFLYNNFPGKLIYKIYAQYCDSALFYISLTNKKITIRNLTEINSENSDIAPIKYRDGLVFSSNREGTIIKKKTGNTNLPLFDLYLASGKDSLFPDKVNSFSAQLNTVHHECCASFTADYKKIFYTRSIDEQPGDGKGIKNTLKMFSASWDGKNWNEIQTFRFNDTTHSYGQPSVGIEEELFFFASDRAGGYGGTDLYVCFNIDHKWTDPINLGAEVNTAYNELYPFFHPDGTLFFSSNRPEGFGGYDLYKASEDENGDYGRTSNIGFPINSPFDDLSIFWSGDYKVGYLTSNRPGGKGLEDLYLLFKE